MAEVIAVASQEVSIGVPGYDANALADAVDQGEYEVGGKKGGLISVKNAQTKLNAKKGAPFKDTVRKEVQTLISEGKHVSPVSKPDEEVFFKEKAAFNRKFNELKSEHNKLDAMMAALGGRDEFVTKKDQLQLEMNAIDTQLGELNAQKDEISKKLKKCFDENESLKKESKKLRKSVGFQTVDEIERERQKLEVEWNKSSSTRKEEQVYIKKLSDLTQAEKDIDAVMRSQQKSTAAQTSTEPLKDQLKRVNDEIKLVIAKKNDSKTKMRQFFKLYKIKVAPLEKHRTRKQEIGDEMRKLRANFKVVEDAYFTKYREFTRYDMYVRAVQNERMKEDRARKALQGKRAALEKSLENLGSSSEEMELLLLDQALQFIYDLIAERDGTQSVKRADANASEADRLPPPKNKREDEYFLPPKKANKMRNIHTSNKVAVGVDIDTVARFSKYGINFPLPPSEYESSLAILEKHRSKCQKKRDTYLETVGARKSSIEASIQELDDLMSSEDREKIIAAGNVKIASDKQNKRPDEQSA